MTWNLPTRKSQKKGSQGCWDFFGKLRSANSSRRLRGSVLWAFRCTIMPQCAALLMSRPLDCVTWCAPQVGLFTEYRCRADQNQVVTDEFGKPVVMDSRCWARIGHTLTQAGSMFFVFGGTTLRDSTRVNELFWMTTERMEWHLQMTFGDSPAPRDQHTAVFDSTSNRSVATVSAVPPVQCTWMKFQVLASTQPLMISQCY